LPEVNDRLYSAEDGSRIRVPLYRALVITCGLGAALVGFLGIIGLLFGITLFTSVLPGLKTIALSACLGWIILGLVLACDAYRPVKGVIRDAVTILVFFIAVISAIEFPQNLMGGHFVAESFLIRTGDAIFSAPSTPISPLAVILTFISSLTLLLFLVYSRVPEYERQIQSGAGILGTFIALFSFTILLSYLYGNPFLYGTVIIPIAITSALAGLFMGVGLILAAGPESVPLSYVTGFGIRAQLLRMFLPLIVIAIIVPNFLERELLRYPVFENSIVVTILIVGFVIITSYIAGKVSGFFSENLEREQQKRKCAEDTEQETRKYLENLIRYANAPIITWDLEFRITEFNRAFETLTGLSRKDVIGEPLTILFPGDSRNESMARIRSASAGEQWEVVEIPIRHTGGDVRTVIWNSANVSGPDGATIATIAQGTDITERKAAEEALLAQKAFTSDMIETIRDTIFVFDPGTGRAVKWNRAFSQASGYTDEEIKEKKAPSDYYSNEDLTKAAAVMERISQGGTATLEMCLNTKDGRCIPTEYRASMISDPDGKSRYILAVGRDLTERLQTEAVLLANERHLASIFDTVSDTIFILAVEPGEQYRFSSVNSAFCRVTGLPAEVVVGRTVHEIIPGPSLGLVLSKYRQAIAEKTLISWEETSDYPTGQLIGAVSVMPIYDTTGTCTHLVGAVHDITRYKRTEEALRESGRQLQEAQDMAHLGFWTWDIKTGTVEWSDEVFRIFGLDSNEFSPQIDSILALSPWPEDHQRDRELIQKTIDSREPGSYEQRFLRPDKSTGYYYSTFQGRYNDAGDLVSIVGTVLDITERKEAEIALAESERKYRNLYQYAQVGLFETSLKDAKVVACNQRYADLFGAKTAEDAIGQDILSVYINPEERNEVTRILRETGQIRDHVVRFRNKLTGREFWGQFSARYNYDRDVAEGTILDITEQKEALENLRISEERFRGVFDASTAGKSLTSAPDGKMLRINQAFADMLGYTRDELQQMNFAAITYPDDKPESQECVRGLIAGEKASYRMEKRYIQKTGRIVWADVSTSLLKDSSGKPLYFITTILDISERKRIESLIRETNEILNQAQMLAHVGSWQFDLVNDVVTWSDETYRIFGYEPGMFDLNLENIRKVIHPDDLEKHDRIIADAISTHYYQPEEYRLIRPDGSIRVIYGDGKAVTDNSGNVVKLVGVIQDVTEHKKAEEELRREHDQTQRYLHIAGVMLTALDADGHITLINKKGCEILGWDQDDLTGRNWFDVAIPPDRRDEVRSVFNKLLAGEIMPVEYYENPVVTRSGLQRILAFHNTEIKDPAGRITGIIFSGEDITERKQIEQQRETLIGELEQKNSELERFTFTVSHDLKSPLITIKGFAGLLEEDSLGGDPRQLKNDINRIIIAAETMQALLSDLLELSRVGKIVHPPSRTSFGTIAHDAVELLAGPLAERGVTVEIAPDLPVVNVDQARIREALVNLIENAIKFSGDRANPVIRIGVHWDGAIPVFFVEDNGIGINPRYLGRIFNLFEKLDPSQQGTGIGLPIVRRIIEVHGGKIWAESEGEGTGTTFRFTLPGGTVGGNDRP
jgi:PAS domain S-box-containing protein